MANINFRGMKAELGTLCSYQFPRVNDNCHRFAPGRPQPQDDEDWQDEMEKMEELFYEPTAVDPLRSKRHVFANIWERSIDPRGTCNPSIETWTIDFRQWPPDVPKISRGVKIPVEFEENHRLRVKEANAESDGTAELYQNLKGLFNPCQTSSIEVVPPALLFLNSRVGQFYSCKVRLKNIDAVPRRIKIVPPKNTAFTVSWTYPHTSIIPGISVAIQVQYRPTSNASLNEVLFIAIEGAGGLTIPLVAASEPPPILEFDEWDCGCSVIESPRTSHFDIRNIGSEGRFWLLTDNEFRNQVIAYPKRMLQLPGPTHGRNRTRKSLPASEVAVTTGPFSINTACFKLLRNQKIKISVKYIPKTSGFHHEKLAIMSDNGEVRWIGVRGMGIDMNSKDLVDLQVPLYWSAPPIDLPFDVDARYAIDFSDLLPASIGQTSLRAVNKSCITMYYFWSVRPLNTGLRFGRKGSTEGHHGRTCFHQFNEGTTEPADWASFMFSTADEDDAHGGAVTQYSSQYAKLLHQAKHGHEQRKEVVDLKVNPAQGILKPRQCVDMNISASCPQKTGYYGCVMSMYIEQVNEESMAAIMQYLRELRETGFMDVPIHYDFLKQSQEDQKEHLGEGDEGLQYLLEPKKCEPPYKNRESPFGTDTNDLSADSGRPTTWAKNVEDLKPMVEVEVWFRSMPLEIDFSPPFIVANGIINTKINRTITVTNYSQWAVEIQFENLLEITGIVCCDPHKITLDPMEKTNINALVCFKSHGKLQNHLKASMNVVGCTTKVPITLPCSISSTGPYIETVTPVIHFGYVQLDCERMKTIAITNTGTRPARWTAFVNPIGLSDFEGRSLSPHNCTIEEMKLMRVWPSWGVLEPRETMGINVYLSAEIEGDLIATVSVSVDGVPDSTLHIPVTAVVQRPFLYLEETEVYINKERMVRDRVDDCILTLANPTGFPISFVWQPCLVGRNIDLLSAEFCPPTGFVPPRGTMDIILTINAKSEYVDLRHLYAVCMADGMKEPIVARIASDHICQ